MSISSTERLAPSPIPFSEESPVPRELSIPEIEEIIHRFYVSTKLVVKSGFDTIELHGAHGYLLHQFLSPNINKRKDKYGEYSRFPLEVIRTVKNQMPEDMPLIFRISAVEYAKGGYGLDYIQQQVPKFIEAGVDVFDVSTGGDGPVKPIVYPGYQVNYANEIKKNFNIPVMSVGVLDNPSLADSIIRNGQTDLVAIGKGLLRNPYWPKEAALVRGTDIDLP